MSVTALRGLPDVPSPSMSDAELVELSLRGEIGPFGQLIERYQSLVCAVAFSATGDRALSEDVAQETFIAAWKGLGDIHDQAKIRSWLCGIARNLSKMAIRKRGREVLVAETDEPQQDIDAAAQPNPLDSVISKETEQLVWGALKGIPETYREPLVLFYREDQSVKQVALGLDLTEDTVKQRLSRGRQQLRKGLASIVEQTLGKTRPGKALTVAILAAIAARTGTAAAAGVAASSAPPTSAGGGAAAKSTAASIASGGKHGGLLALVALALVAAGGLAAYVLTGSEGQNAHQIARSSAGSAASVDTSKAAKRGRVKSGQRVAARTGSFTACGGLWASLI